MLLKIFILLILLVTIYLSYLFYRRLCLRELLINLVAEFEKENVTYWIDFGSLLGVCRDGDVILGDNDGDVCILQDEENIEKVSRIVEKMGGKYFDWGAFRIYKGSFFIDIYLIYLDGNFYKTSLGEPIPKKLIHPIVKKDYKLGSHKVQLSVPEKTKEVLEHRYGNTWHIKARKWYLLYTN